MIFAALVIIGLGWLGWRKYCQYLGGKMFEAQLLDTILRQDIAAFAQQYPEQWHAINTMTRQEAIAYMKSEFPDECGD